ncbi:hypothetical protein AC578_5937 [Pseudocercospora eumusae]|uniref:SnoaL-like domain-containing protein n=1 Tax=Pseudocercospora eumusae TaxID=321146 RepID=A0A139HI35_9PEZI|nr:hypothetical protein AC578_5937 [Pseudocercospora eumusae]
MSSTPQSPQRQALECLVQAFNRMDIDTIVSFRHEDCMRVILPASMGHRPQNNTTYRAQLEQLRPIFQNFRLTLHDIIEDVESRKICAHLNARADTAAGEYVNEYMWTLEFNEATKIIKWSEFVDTGVNRDFWPKLEQAMQSYRQSQTRD